MVVRSTVLRQSIYNAVRDLGTERSPFSDDLSIYNFLICIYPLLYSLFPKFSTLSLSADIICK